MLKIAIVLVVLVLTSLVASSCKQAKKVEASQVEVVSNSNTSTKQKVGNHLCNGLTRSGKGCTRLVSDSHGKSAKCWQHQEKD